MKHAWSLYVGVLLALGLGRMAEKIITETGGFGSRYGPAILAVTLAIGVLGQVAQKPIARRWIWVTIFWLLAIVSGGLSILAVSQLLERSYRMAGLILGILLMLSPGLWHLFRYAHRSPSLWRTASDPAP